MNEPFLTHARLVKQTGGCCLFAVVVLAWHPAPSLLIENGTQKENFPPEFFPAVKQGIEELLSPDTCARVVLVDGLSHPVDSQATSFRTAGKWATKKAVPRLNFTAQPISGGPGDIAEQWRQTQTSLVRDLKAALSQELHDFQYYHEREVWWREAPPMEHLIRLETNTRFVPTTLDLSFAFSVPRVLTLLEAEDWRAKPGQQPQEIGARRLSSLAEREPFLLDHSIVATVLEALSRHGRRYFEACRQPDEILKLTTYLDAGTRSAIHYICGEKETARQTASRGLKNALGNPRLSRACEKILDLP